MIWHYYSLGSIERRAPKSALFFACRFFFLVRPLFSFLAWRAIFLRALFSPSFFFIFPTILASKPCFWAVFPVFLFAPSFALFFFSFESALFFLFSYGGLFFLRPLFALLFFFALLSIEPNLQYISNKLWKFKFYSTTVTSIKICALSYVTSRFHWVYLATQKDPTFTIVFTGPHWHNCPLE